MVSLAIVTGVMAGFIRSSKIDVSSFRGGAKHRTRNPEDDGARFRVRAIARPGMTKPSRQSHDLARVAGQFQNVHAGIGAIDDIDIAALVGLDIVGLDRDLAAVLAVD